MKIKPIASSIVVCVGLLLSLNSFAQDQMPKGQLLAIHQDIVMPSKVAEYEKAVKTLAEKFAEHKMTSMPYTAANSEDFTYMFIMPVENYAGLDKMETSFNDLKTKMGEEEFMALMNQFNGTYESSKAYLVKFHPELSYNPEYGSETSQGLNFRRWDYYYVKSGMEQQAIEIANAWKDLYGKHKVTQGYRLYMGDWGTEMPLIIVTQPAMNAAEYYATSQKLMDKFGEEGKQLMQKTMSVVRKFETKNGAMRPDLSYMPTPVATTEN